MEYGHNLDLLLAVLAAQLGFLTDTEFRKLMVEWNSNRDRAVYDILLTRAMMSRDRLDLLQALSEALLKKHAGNLNACLNAITLSDSVEELLCEQTVSLAPLLAGRGVNQETVVSVRPTSDGSVATDGGPAIARFSIIRPHARGGLGEVFVAFDHELNRQVALKEIKGAHAFSEDSRLRFMQEAEITGGLEHPGIVPVYGLGSYQDGRPFYAMRFIKGESLAEAATKFHSQHRDLKRECYRSAEFRMLLRRLIDVCNAIEYAHARGILHRDLKPGNIMLGKYGETLVVDWGLAKPLDTQTTASNSNGDEVEEKLRPSSGSWSGRTSLGQMVGTVSYMSPEAAQGQLELLGVASDVFCLGATLYFILTGRPPYQPATNAEAVEAARSCRFDSPRSIVRAIPKQLEAVCLLAMSKEPSSRYGSAQLLAKDLEQWLADDPVIAFREPFTDKFGRWLRHHRAIVSTAAASGIVILLLSIAFAAFAAQSNRQLQKAVLVAQESMRNAQESTRKAEENAKTARDIALHITNISDKFLAEESKQLSFREELLTSVHELFRQAYQQDSTNVDDAIEFAEAARNLTIIKIALKKYPEAQQLIKESIAIQLKFPPADKVRLDYLASSYRDQASIHKTLGELKQAAESLQLAAETMERIRQNFEIDDAYSRGIALLSIEQVGLANELTDYAAAYDFATQAETLELQLVASQTVTDADYTLANMASYRRGQALFALDRIDEGTQVYEAAIERGSNWGEKISSMNYRPFLARLHLYYADDLALLEAPPARAEEVSDEATRLYSLLYEVQPTVEHQYYVACCKRTRAVLHQRRKEYDQAKSQFDKCLQMFEEIIDKNPVANNFSVFGRVLSLKARLLEELGDRTAAAETMQSAIERIKQAIGLAPDSSKLSQNLLEFEEQLSRLTP